LGKRKDQNILKLEIDEIMNESGPGEIPDLSLNFLPGALNFFSSRSASFTAPIKGKGITNSFLKLLDSPGKNAEMSQGSS
jgi:hypothetical protein